MLYDNHCSVCHDKTIHRREHHRVSTLEELREWIIRWQLVLDLDWNDRDVDEVKRYLNGRFYGLPTP